MTVQGLKCPTDSPKPSGSSAPSDSVHSHCAVHDSDSDSGEDYASQVIEKATGDDPTPGLMHWLKGVCVWRRALRHPHVRNIIATQKLSITGFRPATPAQKGCQAPLAAILPLLKSRDDKTTPLDILQQLAEQTLYYQCTPTLLQRLGTRIRDHRNAPTFLEFITKDIIPNDVQFDHEMSAKDDAKEPRAEFDETILAQHMISLEIVKKEELHLEPQPGGNQHLKLDKATSRALLLYLRKLLNAIFQQAELVKNKRRSASSFLHSLKSTVY